MPVYYDQLKRAVSLPSTPKRIISIVPSQTELLFYLGLDENIVGITNFCTHPADKVGAIAKVGGTKKLNINLIKQLQPDLVVANKEENDRGQIEELTQLFPVWISNVDDLPGAIDMVNALGAITGRENEAKALSGEIGRRFNKLQPAALNLRVAYLIWRKPYMVVGAGTFINSMLQTCGLVNAFDVERYPEVNIAMLADARPAVVLLSSEPYPFNEKHIAEFKAILPDARVILVDGEMFSWYGSRLLLAPGYFASLVSSLVQ